MSPFTPAGPGDKTQALIATQPGSPATTTAGRDSSCPWQPTDRYVGGMGMTGGRVNSAERAVVATPSISSETSTS